MRWEKMFKIFWKAIGICFYLGFGYVTAATTNQFFRVKILSHLHIASRFTSIISLIKKEKKKLMLGKIISPFSQDLCVFWSVIWSKVRWTVFQWTLKCYSLLGSFIYRFFKSLFPIYSNKEHDNLFESLTTLQISNFL